MKILSVKALPLPEVKVVQFALQVSKGQHCVVDLPALRPVLVIVVVAIEDGALRINVEGAKRGSERENSTVGIEGDYESVTR